MLSPEGGQPPSGGTAGGNKADSWPLVPCALSDDSGCATNHTTNPQQLAMLSRRDAGVDSEMIEVLDPVGRMPRTDNWLGEGQ